MTAINRQPAGILDFLGIKNFGRAPDSLSSTLAPTWDLSEQYLSTNALWVKLDLGLSAVGYSTWFQAAPGEVLHILNFGIYSDTLAAGEVLRTNVAISDAAGLVQVPIGPIQERIAAPNERVVVGLAQPLTLYAGESIGLWTTEIATAATIAVVANARIVRMRV